MQGEAQRKIKAMQSAQRADKADAKCETRLRSMLADDRGTLTRADKEGRTLLHHAASAGYSRSTAFLLRSGAEGAARDAGGATPADLARRAGHLELAATIEKYPR